MTRYVHFRNSNKTNGITVAYEFTGDRDSLERTVVYGASFCSPKDQFNKKFGRMVAENRLNSDRGCTTFDVKLTDLKNINIQIICAIRKHLFENDKLPNHSNDLFSLFFPSFGPLDKFYSEKLNEMGLSYYTFRDEDYLMSENFEEEDYVEVEAMEVFDNA